MGLIRGIDSISNHKDVSANEEMYRHIDVWGDLYAGYHEPFHKIHFNTVEGQKTRRMDTLMMAKSVSAEMASLVFNEKCEISISDNPMSDFIDDVFKRNKFYKKFQDHLEYNFALGGMVIKPYVQEGQVKISFVTADCFIPLSWHNDQISEAVFSSEYKRGDKKYTHLEWHTWDGGTYVITNELYEADGSDLGVKIPLETMFPDLEPEVSINRLRKQLFTYFKPNTANNIDTQSPLGISLYANALDTMRSIDTAFDSFHREFRLGKKRIIVPAHMVKTVVNPDTAEMHRYFDASDETYEALNHDMDEDKIHDINVELRVDEHVSAINSLLNLFAMQTGFSAGSFSFDGESMKTATEVVSEQSKTFKSKKSHEIIIEAGLQEVIESIIDVAELYEIASFTDDYEISVTFDDSVVEDKQAEVNKQVQLVNNKLQSKVRAIMTIHGLTEEEAQQLQAEISEENATANAEAVDFFGGNNNG